MNGTNDIIELYWRGLIPIKNIDNDINPKRGVYCWGFRKNNQFMPYYIGIAENITHRIYEHFNSIIGGKYTLFHEDSLFNFVALKDNKLTNKNEGKIYIPDWPKGYKNFIINREEFKRHINYMIDHLTFSYALVKESDCSKKDLVEIEKKCIMQIGKKNLINTRGGESIISRIDHFGDKNLTQFFK